MKKVSVLVFILCTLCSQLAFAASWYWIGSDSSGEQWYIDNASVRKDYYNAIVWTKIDNTDSSYAQEQFIFNHYNKTYAMLAYANYDENGQLTDSNTFDSPEYGPIVPDSMADAIYHDIWSN